jgi:hypothetical protein
VYFRLVINFTSGINGKAKQCPSRAKIPNHLLAACFHQNLLIEPIIVEPILAIFKMCLCTRAPCFELPAKLFCLLLPLLCWENPSKSWAKEGNKKPFSSFTASV